MAYPESPEAWRDYLLALHARNLPDRLRLASYYDGTFGGPNFDARYAAAYRNIWNEARSNWGRLIIDAAADRMAVVGIRLDSDDADETAWRLWQRSSLDARQAEVYTDALLFGIGSVLVWPDAAGEPLASPESSLEVSYAMAPGTSGKTLAAIKVWADPIANMVRADVFLPDAVWRWALDGVSQILEPVTNRSWRLVDDNAIANPFAPDLPLVPFETRLRLGVIQGDLDDIMPTIDRLTRLQSDALLVSSCLGFPQRWATGIEIPRDPDGTPIAPFKAAIDRLWMSEGADTKFGSFQQADMTSIIKAIDMTVAEIAARSRTPAHMLISSQLANPPSAQALQVMESGLISRVKARERSYGESWERVVSLMLRVIGDPRADLYTSEVIWQDPETHSESVRAFSLTQLQMVGVPNETLWELWGFTPLQIDRMKGQAIDQALTEALAIPAAERAAPTP
jgi:Phage portal protein, SPP1 Gp6-like